MSGGFEPRPRQRLLEGTGEAREAGFAVASTETRRAPGAEAGSSGYEACLRHGPWRDRSMAQKANDVRTQTNLSNESPDYTSKREELRLAEIELMRQRERVAQLRRQLPEGAIVENYVFEEGP